MDNIDNIIILKFKWECDKCGNIVHFSAPISDSVSVRIRPHKKCVCNSAGRQYELLDVEKMSYLEVKDEASTHKATR